MYLPLRDKQEDGYPRFDVPGVISGYFVAPYIPGDDDNAKMLGFQKVTQLLSSDGATSVTTMATAVVAAIAHMLF